MKSKHRIAGVVVLYRPDAAVTANISSYLDQVERLYVVDNSSDASFGANVETLGEKAVYLPNFKNLGIATALNIGAKKADGEGYGLLLTLDQDSRADSQMVDNMLRCLERPDGGKVGIVAPHHDTGTGRKFSGGACLEVMTPMTSGCLLNLSAYREVGPFLDKLFIDFVDNEYCLRLRRFGFAVLRANQALLWHRVGETKKYGPFIATHHSPLRRYYKTRNRFWVFREYFKDFPGHCLFDLVRFAKEIASILIFEREKKTKLMMILKGARDFVWGRLGPFEGH